MGRARQLTEFEKGQIKILRDHGHNWNQIGREIGRDGETCKRYYMDPKNYGINYKTGRPSSLSKRSKMLISREASNKMTSSTVIVEKLNLQVSPRTVRRVLNSSPHLKYAKMTPKPILTKLHKERRLAWAREKVVFGKNWETTIFSDEKKFNLDGPDGFAYYWHDLRKEKRIFSTRGGGGGSVMIWAGFSSTGRTSIAFCQPKMNSIDYQNLMADHLLPLWLHPDQNHTTFQQDNAPIHKSKSTLEWFDQNAIVVMDWPACSPDLNPIENVWGILARRVYAEGKHFGSLQELKLTIIREWEALPQDLLKKLVNSMPKRVGDVIFHHGRHLDN